MRMSERLVQPYYIPEFRARPACPTSGCLAAPIWCGHQMTPAAEIEFWRCPLCRAAFETTAESAASP